MAGRVTLSDAERAIVEGVLAFANTPRLTSGAAVEAHFLALPIVAEWQEEPVWLTLREEADGGLAAFQRDRLVIRGWLEALAVSEGRGGYRRWQATREAVRALLNDTVPAVVTIDADGRLVTRFALSGVQAVCAFAVALLLDQSRGLLGRLRACAAPECLPRFVLTWEGKPRQFCGRGHQEAAKRELTRRRVEEFRWEQRRKKK